MTSRGRATLGALACVALGSPGLAAPAPAWRVYADCAAAYLANARLSDPDRPASMTAQVSDVAADYSTAAAKRRQVQVGGSAATSRRRVDARVARQARVLGARPREEVEHMIDACPQVAS